MRELRRRRPKAISPLEVLDERIAPSVIAPNALKMGNHVERSTIQVRMRQRHHRAARAAIAALVPGGPLSMGAAAPQVDSTPAVPSTPAPSAGSTPAGGDAVPSPSASVDVNPPTVNVTTEEVRNGPLAKAGEALITISKEFQQNPSSDFTSSLAGFLRLEGSNVGVDIHSKSGNLNALIAQLNSLGMRVETVDAAHGLVEGVLPIAQLTAVAQNSQVSSISPIYNLPAAHDPLGG